MTCGVAFQAKEAPNKDSITLKDSIARIITKDI